MKKHIEYLKRLLTHKYWVFIWSLKLDVPLYLAIFHDISKFSPSEWFPYVNNFYNDDGSKKDIRDKTGGYSVSSQSKEFRQAWIHHQNSNKHHWQYWVIPSYNGICKSISRHIVAMPEKYIREMIADWISAGICVSGKADPINWYNKTKWDMGFADETIEILENILYNEVKEILDKTKEM